MNRKEYEEKLSEKRMEISNIENEIKELTEQYCNDCSPFKVGDKIRFYRKEGVITKIYPVRDKFEYIWRPFRKDGNEGAERKIWSFDFNKIEKL